MRFFSTLPPFPELRFQGFLVPSQMKMSWMFSLRHFRTRQRIVFFNGVRGWLFAPDLLDLFLRQVAEAPARFVDGYAQGAAVLFVVPGGEVGEGQAFAGGAYYVSEPGGW
jgi:hypothetical protein